MTTREELINKLYAHPISRSFTIRELNKLMNECNCLQFSGGRGSSLKYFHKPTERILTFDGPHPGKELYPYHIKMVRKFLEEIGEVK